MNAIPAKDAENPDYILNIENFSGPLDLLWELIKNAKIDVTEIYISQVTEQYIAYLKLMEKMNIKIASEFILTASDLLYYKSKALLPADQMEDEYFLPPLSRDLIEKLIEYKKIQLTSLKLKDYFENQSDAFYRKNTVISNPVSEEEFTGISLYDLVNAFAGILTVKNEIIYKEIIFDEILVSDRIEYIHRILADKSNVLFNDLFMNIPGRSELIATFLAILEMAKYGKIKIMQHIIYGDIRILRNS